MDVIKGEMSRNMSAYFLTLAGLGCLWMGSARGFPEMVKAGAALQGAALLAFQAKRSPDGNTTTTSVTVPPPSVAEPVVAGPK